MAKVQYTVEQLNNRIQELTAEVNWLRRVLLMEHKDIHNPAPKTMHDKLIAILTNRQMNLDIYTDAAKRFMEQTIEIEEG